MADDPVDQGARDKAGEALHAVQSFRVVAEQRLQMVENKIDEVKGALKWAGGLIVTLILTVLGWAVTQQINSNEAQKKDMQQQITLLKQQEETRTQYREEVLSRLPPRAAEATRAAPGE